MEIPEDIAKEAFAFEDDGAGARLSILQKGRDAGISSRQSHGNAVIPLLAENQDALLMQLGKTMLLLAMLPSQVMIALPGGLGVLISQ